MAPRWEHFLAVSQALKRYLKKIFDSPMKITLPRNYKNDRSSTPQKRLKNGEPLKGGQQEKTDNYERGQPHKKEKN